MAHLTKGRPTCSSHTEDGAAGFTLIEVLVALALVAALSVVMVSVIEQLRTITNARKVSDAIIEADALEVFLEHTIRDARSRTLILNSPEPYLMMSGDQRSLTFVGAIRLGTVAYGFRNIRIFFDKRPGLASKLMMSLERRRSDSQSEPELIELAQLDDFSLQYIAAKNLATGEQDWSDHWAEYAKLPHSVRIHFVMTRHGRPVVRDKLVSIRGCQEFRVRARG